MAAEGPSPCGSMDSCAKGAQRGRQACVRARPCLTGPLITWGLTERGPIWPKSGFLIVKSWYISALLGHGLKVWAW